MAAILQSEKVLFDIQESIENGSYNTKEPARVPDQSINAYMVKNAENLNNPKILKNHKNLPRDFYQVPFAI